MAGLRLPTTFQVSLSPRGLCPGDCHWPAATPSPPPSQASDQQIPKAPHPADLEVSLHLCGSEPPSAGGNTGGPPGHGDGEAE